MGRKKKQPTKTVRLYVDLAVMVKRVAGAMNQDVADFLDATVRAFVVKKQEEASKSLATPLKIHKPDSK